MNARTVLIGLLVVCVTVTGGIGTVSADVQTVNVDVSYTDSDGNSQALEGATVELVDSSGSVVDTATTGTDGTVSFSSVADGDYTAEVDDGYGNMKTVSTFTVGTSSISKSVSYSTSYTAFEVSVAEADADNVVSVELQEDTGNGFEQVALKNTNDSGVATFDSGYDTSNEYKLVLDNGYSTKTVSLDGSNFSDFSSTTVDASTASDSTENSGGGGGVASGGLDDTIIVGGVLALVAMLAGALIARA